MTAKRGFWSRPVGKVALLLVSVALMLGAIEVAFRVIVGPSPYLSGLRLGQYPDNPRDYFDDFGEYFSVRSHPNRHACDKAIDSQRGQVLFLGDSFTFGLGVRTGDNLSNRVHFPRHQVRNCARSGRNLGGVIRDLKRELTRYRPSLTVYGMVLNDFGPDSEPEGIKHALEAGLTLCQLRNPYSTPSTDFTFFDTSTFERVVDTRRDALGFWGFLLHPRTVEWFFVRSLKAELGKQTIAWYRRCFSPGPEFERALDVIADLGDGSEHFLVMLWPLFVDLQDYSFQKLHYRIRKGLNQRGVEVLDLAEVFVGMDDLDLAVHDIDRHPNERAHAMAAVALAKYLKRLNWLPVEAL